MANRQVTKASMAAQPSEKHKVIIGLAGGPGSGKSTVADEFEKLGCAVIRADVLNHEILRRPAIIKQVRTWWGERVLGADGQIDRETLGEIVFNDENELKKLTDLVHPLVEARQQELIQGQQDDPQVKAIVLDVPLLFEVGQNTLCDTVIFVRAEESVRLSRLQKRGWTAKKAKKAENLQFALDTKGKMSDHTLDNNSSIPVLARQVAKLFSLLVLEKRP